MVIFGESAASLKGFVGKTSLGELGQAIVLRMALAFIMHRGRMSCSEAGGSIASETFHRGQITRFLARPRWQRADFNAPLREALLQMETGKGKFFFIIDATLTSQSGGKTQNTHSTGNRKRRPKKGRRYNKKKVTPKRCHSFTFGLLITPSGYRIPWQIPHYTKEYCAKKGLEHRTTAEAAADLIRDLPLPEEADVVVLGDTALRRECCATGVRGSKIHLDRSGQPGARLRRTDGPTPESAFSFEGLDESVAENDQASSVDGEVCQVPASLQVACWAETETARILRLSGKM